MSHALKETGRWRSDFLPIVEPIYSVRLRGFVGGIVEVALYGPFERPILVSTARLFPPPRPEGEAFLDEAERLEREPDPEG